MQAPPPPAARAWVMDRTKMIVVFGIGVGLLLLAGGAVLSDFGNQSYVNPTPEQTVNSQNLRNVWGPALAHIGMFFFVGGLFIAAIFLETADPFVRLFLLILGFVALLLVLANSPTLFG